MTYEGLLRLDCSSVQVFTDLQQFVFLFPVSLFPAAPAPVFLSPVVPVPAVPTSAAPTYVQAHLSGTNTREHARSKNQWTNRTDKRSWKLLYSRDKAESEKAKGHDG